VPELLGDVHVEERVASLATARKSSDRYRSRAAAIRAACRATKPGEKFHGANVTR